MQCFALRKSQLHKYLRFFSYLRFYVFPISTFYLAFFFPKRENEILQWMTIHEVQQIYRKYISKKYNYAEMYVVFHVWLCIGISAFHFLSILLQLSYPLYFLFTFIFLTAAGQFRHPLRIETGTMPFICYLVSSFLFQQTTTTTTT